MRSIVSIIVALAMVLPTPASAAAPELNDVSRFIVGHGYQVFKLTKLPTGHEVIDVDINGQAGTFVLDSGAGATVVRHDRLAKFGLGAATGEKQGAGAGGGIAITSHPIGSIEFDGRAAGGGWARNPVFTDPIGSIEFDGRAVPLKQVYGTNLDSVVARLKAATGTEIDGVVGQDILGGFSGIINIGSSELYLKLPAG